MSVTGIICEYNPLHLGHVRQLETVRRICGPDTAIVCLMSGNYVQRGEPAIFDKTVRARAAAEAGADLVLELPLTAAVRSAEGFAESGVQILRAVGADTLCFGCESGSADALMQAARAMQAPDFPERLRAALKTGVSYAAARQQAAVSLGADAAVMSRPNDILALEYCRAMARFAPQMSPLAIPRPGDYRSASPCAGAPSALAVRQLLLAGGGWQALVPSCAQELFAQAPLHALPFGERAMLARLRALTPADWAGTPYTSEGLWSKAFRAAQAEPSVQALADRLRTRRYPMTRVRRMLLCAYLGIDSRMLEAPAPYVRILAFRERGRAVLRAARSRAELPLINAGELPPDGDYYALECRAADLYSLFVQPDALPEAGCEQKYRIYRKKN